MTVPPISLAGCRHDVLGHALKAIGILRALSECASPKDRDSSAEGWWNPDTSTFMIRSELYPDAQHLVQFFAKKYRPTPLIAAWNKSGGVTDKVEVTISGGEVSRFRGAHEAQLQSFGLTKGKKLSKAGELKFSTDSANKFEVERLVADFNAAATSPEQARGADGQQAPTQAVGPLCFSAIPKKTGKEDGVLPTVAKLLANDGRFQECLELARQSVGDLQGSADSDESGEIAFLKYRDRLPDDVAEALDALCAVHVPEQNDNPLFIRRGRPGDKVRGHIFLNFWDYFGRFRKAAEAFSRFTLFGERVVAAGVGVNDQKGKGTPFFPDAIKSYNQGLDWVTEEFPFCPLDYVLAVEGALAMRGATSKGLGARSRSRAAFPFVFEGSETMTDEQGKALRLASSFWLPIWTRRTTYRELRSFFLDSQARLPSKECRFSSDFARAIRSQGVDAGFLAFQEFRFKLKGANVPWTTAGRLVACANRTAVGTLNELLAPVDASGFLNQFEFNREREEDLHPLRAPVLDAIDIAASEPDPRKIIDVLCRLATLNSHLARSKGLRERVSGTGRVTFVPPLSCREQSTALRALEADPEFEIARALASIWGHEKQPDGRYSEVEPFLGSLLPLRRNQSGWFLPDKRSPQAVWTGIDLARDLASVLARRILDSAADARPAIVGNCTAKLTTVLAFLDGELDDRRIASLVEALSLIDWRSWRPSPVLLTSSELHDDEPLEPVPAGYAAVRGLLEIACDRASRNGSRSASDATPRVHVQRMVSLVSRQEPRTIAAGLIEALRRLAIVGVPNTYGDQSRRQKQRLAGRDVVELESVQSHVRCDDRLSRRLAAAALVPLDPRDRWKLFRAISLPQSIQ